MEIEEVKGTRWVLWGVYGKGKDRVEGFGVTEISVKDLGYVGTPEQHAFSKLFR